MRFYRVFRLGRYVQLTVAALRGSFGLGANLYVEAPRYAQLGLELGFVSLLLTFDGYGR